VRRFLLLLLSMMLGTIALANEPADVSPFGVLSGSTITCSATGAVAGCYLERPVWVAGPLEFTVGIDAQLAYAQGRTGHLAPYAGAAWYADSWSAWLEVHLPESGIPTLGRPDWWRVGMTWRLP